MNTIKSVHWYSSFFPSLKALYNRQWLNSEFWLFQLEFKIEIGYHIILNKKEQKSAQTLENENTGICCRVLCDNVTSEIMLELPKKNKTQQKKPNHCKTPSSLWMQWRGQIHKPCNLCRGKRILQAGWIGRSYLLFSIEKLKQTRKIFPTLFPKLGYRSSSTSK